MSERDHAFKVLRRSEADLRIARAERDALAAELKAAKVAIALTTEHDAALAAELERVKAALVFYADQDHWTQLTSWGGRIFDDESDAVNDCGQRARSALAAAEGTE